jgi:hypothetical protein
MGTLWTPGGEREVPPAEPTGSADSGEPSAEEGSTGAPGGTTDALRAAAEAIGVDLDSLNDEERAELASQLEEMMAVRRQVAQTPASEMLANHLMRLFDLATIYLETDPPSFSDAATVIEAFRSTVDGLGDRLGEHKAMLTEAQGQLQMLFVQVKNSTDAPNTD